MQVKVSRILIDSKAPAATIVVNRANPGVLNETKSRPE